MSRFHNVNTVKSHYIANEYFPHILRYLEKNKESIEYLE